MTRKDKDMTQTAVFWDRLADRYAAQPIKDQTAYEQTLDRTRSYLSETDSVLELGCGTGTTALILAPHVGHITATDYSEGMIRIGEEKARADGARNVTFRQAGLTDARLGKNAYDAVLAFNLFHLVPDLDTALRGVSDFIKPGGYLISKTACLAGNPLFRVMVPLMRLIGKAPYVSFMTRAELEAKITRAGFRIVETGDHPAKGHTRFIVAQKL